MTKGFHPTFTIGVRSDQINNLKWQETRVKMPIQRSLRRAFLPENGQSRIYRNR
jgi:hypothetical protein